MLAKQGEFLGLFSFDNVAVVPLDAFRKYNNVRRGAEIRIKIKDKTRLNEAREELTGAMRRVREAVARRSAIIFDQRVAGL